MAEAESYVINERALTDDTLTLAPDGHTFKGGYVAIVTYHTFANPWSDDTHVRRFRSMAAMEAFVQRRYGKPWEALVFDGAEDD